MLVFQRGTRMGADTTFVQKQFRKRRENKVLLPELDMQRCADKVCGQCRVKEKLTKFLFQAAPCRGYSQSPI